MDAPDEDFDGLPHGAEIENTEDLRPALVRLEEARQAILRIPDHLLPGEQDAPLRAIKEALGSTLLALEAVDGEVSGVRSRLRPLAD